MQELYHPNIMHLFEFLITGNNYYLVIQYCDQGDLEQHLKIHKKLGEEEAVYFLRQIMNGFRVLHQNKIMHRDVKLANIFLTNQDRVVIGDFGFAKKGAYMTETILGTPITMAPEIITQQNKPGKKQKYDNKADLWSIGIVFYQLIFGDIPFKVKNLEQLIKQIRERSGKNLPCKGANISSECKDLLMKLICYDSKKRIGWNDFFNHDLFKLHQGGKNDFGNL